IVAPPRTGKTVLLQNIAHSIATNHPECYLIVLLIDERPEEVTEFRSAITSGEVVASTFDRPPEEHVMVAELSLEHALRLVEYGNDVVIVVDGLTRLTRAYQAVGTPSGKPMTGTIERAALYPVKRLFGSARKVADGGSLTIIATASIDSGSAADQLIFEEIVGAATVEIYLDRALALKQVFPAVDVVNSSTRHVDELLGA
ncbi:MAG TPA: transcription termination factor Rho, partial [Acidimicrobiaceae bacterium]|nr:transcription termination factor Rho [Acidimicrobiaceae bacterium]